MYSQLFHLHSELLSAMGHPKRLEVINLLRSRTLTVSEIMAMLDLPQANLSQHLMVLREQKIVKTEKLGKEISYSLAHPNFAKASDLLREVIIDYYGSELGSMAREDITKFLPLTTDPVCGMRVSPKSAGDSTVYKGKSYYFCASGCRNKFVQSPAKYS